MSLEDLVSQVKDLQRKDNWARDCWGTFCAKRGGIKDPMKHDPSALQEFIDSYHAGTLSGPSKGSVQLKGDKGKGKGYGKGWGKDAGWGKGGGNGTGWGGGGGGGWATDSGAGSGGGMTDLAEMVKMGLRLSPNWKQAWLTYCDMYGEGKHDARRHSKDHLCAFIDYLGSVGSADLDTAAEQVGVAIKRVSDGGMPPPKRTPAQTDLITRVKALQRASPEVKEAWWRMCDTELQGIRDPARHDSVILEGFLLEHEHTVPGFDGYSAPGTTPAMDDPSAV